jgi:hypothetical protein
LTFSSSYVFFPSPPITHTTTDIFEKAERDRQNQRRSIPYPPPSPLSEAFYTLSAVPLSIIREEKNSEKAI